MVDICKEKKMKGQREEEEKKLGVGERGERGEVGKKRRRWNRG